MSSKTEVWVCIGKRFLSGKLYYGWVPTEDLDRNPFYFKKLKGHAGQVYEVDVTVKGDGTSAALQRFQHDHEDTKRVAQWRAETDAAQVAHRLKAAEGRAAARDTYAEVLEPLRMAYRRSDPTGRQVILVKVIAAITRWS